MKAFVEMLALIAEYKLYSEDYDWIAIEYGLRDTDADQDKWYAYPFLGMLALTLEVAQDSGSHVVDVRVTSEKPIASEVAAKWDLLCMICQEYILTRNA